MPVVPTPSLEEKKRARVRAVEWKQFRRDSYFHNATLTTRCAARDEP